jgi:hypothetical protein
MKRLHEIVKEKAELRTSINQLTKETEERLKKMRSDLGELERLENIATNVGMDLEKVQIAESILYFRGKPDSDCEGRILINAAAVDIANGCEHLKSQYYGNKRYEAFYQSTDCGYGMGPSHGGIVDEVGLKQAYRKRELTEDEKDACIYYLKNYKRIASMKSVAQ